MNQVVHLWAERTHTMQTYCGQRIATRRVVKGAEPCYYCNLAVTSTAALSEEDFWRLGRAVLAGWLPAYQWLAGATYPQARLRINAALASELLAKAGKGELV